MRKQAYAIIALFGMLTFVSCKDETKQQQSQAQVQAPLSLKTIKITKQNAEILQEFPAKVEGIQNVEIRPKANGFIEHIYVDEGQQVKKGQLLFKLETQSLSQDAAAAKAAVSAAQVEVDRLKPLVEKGIIGSVLLETAKAKLAQTKATYSGIAANINYANVISPVNGVIGSIPHKVGALVNSSISIPLTTVSDTKEIRVYFNLNEKQMLSFSKNIEGSSIADKIKNAPGVSLKLVDNSIYSEKGKIAAINGMVDATTGATSFRADFKNPNAILRSGSSANILLPTKYENAIVIPQYAVLDLQGKNLVYVIKDGKAISKTVEILNQTDREYVISSGLEEGELLVTEALSKLKEGQAVTPVFEDLSENTQQPNTTKK